MKTRTRIWPTPLPLILAELSALAATLYLFLVPAFKKYQGVIFPGSPPPGLETGWQHFGFWPPISTTPPDMFVLYLMVAPPIIAGLGALFVWIGRGPARATILWSLFAIMVVTLLPRPFDFGFFFIPAAAFLFIAALKETFGVVDRKFELGRGRSGIVQTGKKPSVGLVKIGLLLAVIGWLALFFVPVFNDHGRVVSAWDKYSWNSETSSFIFIFFTIPLIAAGAGLLAARRRNAPSRKVALWIVAAVMIFLALLNAAVYSLYYLPAALVFLAAAIQESRYPVDLGKPADLSLKTVEKPSRN